MRNPALLERGDELVRQAEPGNGELLLVPLEPLPGLEPLVGVAPVGPLLVLLVAPELKPLEGVLAEHGVGRGHGGHRRPPAPPERPAAEGRGA